MKIDQRLIILETEMRYIKQILYVIVFLLAAQIGVNL